MGWLATLLAVWTAIASVAPVATATCESPRCTCCARAGDDDAALQRPPCCARDDAARPTTAPVIAPRTGPPVDAALATGLLARPELAPRGTASAPARPAGLARAPPGIALHLHLGRLLL
jgi:hypothetical protein